MATRRITAKELEALVTIINAHLGKGDKEIGSVRLYSAYGGVGVQQLMNEQGGVTTLCEVVTKREAYYFVRGMLSALRIANDRVSN